jgi:hypothetical protein
MRRGTVGALVLSLLVGGGAGFILGQVGPRAALRTTAQADLFLGAGLIREANRAWRQGHVAAARAWGYQGIADVWAAVNPLRDLGVTGPATLAARVARAEGRVLEGDGQARDWHVIAVVEHALGPFFSTGYGAVPDGELAHVIAQANQRIGPGPG